MTQQQIMTQGIYKFLSWFPYLFKEIKSLMIKKNWLANICHSMLPNTNKYAEYLFFAI